MAVRAHISVTFSEQVVGITAASFLLRNASDTATVNAAVSYDPASRTATLSPMARLGYGTGYLLRLVDVTDVAGNALGEQSIRFTTQQLVLFKAGTFTGYKVSSYVAGNAITASKTATLGRPSSAPAARRVYVAGRGFFYEVQAGIWAGYLIRETPSSYVGGVFDSRAYAPSALVIFPGTAVFHGVTFDASWKVSSSRSLDLPRASSARASRYMSLNGQGYYLMASGALDGLWVPGGAGTAAPFYRYATTTRYLWNKKSLNVQQATSYWCVPASVWTMLNVIRNGSAGSYSQQSAVYSFGRRNLGYPIRARGLDPQAWARALNYFGGNVGAYVDTTYTSYDTAIKQAAKAIAVTGKPVGITVYHGGHGWTLMGFVATADPRYTNNYTVTGVYVMAPYRAWTDPGPGTYYSYSALAAKMTSYWEAERATRWNGKYVLVRPTI